MKTMTVGWIRVSLTDLSQLLRLAMVIVAAAFVMWLMPQWMNRKQGA